MGLCFLFWDMKVSIVIPAYNEEEALGQVLAEIPEGVHQIVVADNGSTDRTREVARAGGACVVGESFRGYGSAVQAGLSAVDPSSDVVVILDGDHSDYPDDLPRLLTPLAEGRADLVIGSRTLGRPERGSLTLPQRFGNALTCFLLKLLYGVPFSDMGPFRAIRRESLELLKMTDKTYGWNVEMQVKALKLGLRIQEVPVRYRRRVGQSKISGTVSGVLGAGVKILWSVFKFSCLIKTTKGEPCQT